jgi:hypothetical protein
MKRRWARWREWIVFILMVMDTALIVISRTEGAGLYQKEMGLETKYGLGRIKLRMITITQNQLAEGIKEKRAMTLALDPSTMRSIN